MISLVFEGKCKDCNHADLHVDRVDFVDALNKYSCAYTVRCDHEGACNRMISVMENREKCER